MSEEISIRGQAWKPDPTAHPKTMRLAATLDL